MENNIFVWNNPSIKFFNIPEQYFYPFIQGYVHTFKNPEITFSLISRRSYMQGGTRYNHRGIDNLGFVANYVETE